MADELLQRRRALMEAILDDPSATHADRLKADERLAELEHSEAVAFAVERLSPEQVAAELESLAAAVPSMLAIARGPEFIEEPVEDSEVEELLEEAAEEIARLDRYVVSLEAALQREHVHRALPPAAEMLG